MLAGCGSTAAPTTVPSAPTPVTSMSAKAPVTNSAPDSTTPIPATTSAPFVPNALAAFGTATVTIDGQDWFVAVADTSTERGDGLRGIDDLGDLDGMIFVYDSEVTIPFTMRAVSQPLEIAFFAGDGSLIETLEMEPCPDDPACPLYESSAPFRWAVESFPGGVALLAPDAHLDVG